MGKLLPIAAILAFSSFNVDAADIPAKEPPRLTTATVEPLVRVFAFRENPKLNKAVKFKIEEFDVDRLWKTLKIQLFVFHYLAEDGTEFNVGSAMYHDGKLTPFMNAYGGEGPMSGVKVDKTLYYTYSSGSGEHRSHVGMLTIEGGEVKTKETKPYFEADLFVKKVGDHVEVELGKFKAFNAWNNGTAFGAPAVKGDELQVVNAKGEEVSSNQSRNPK